MRTKQYPLRTCLGCGQKGLKGELIRIVIVDGTLTIDEKGKLPGRGAYLCPRGDCVDLLLKKRGRLSYSLRTSLPRDAEEDFLRGLLHAKVDKE